MLTVGQGLYNLTQRDQATLYVDSFYRQSTYNLAIGTGAGTDTVGIQLPIDRSLYLSFLNIIADPGAAASWTILGVNMLSDSGVPYPLIQQYGDSINSDNATSAAGSVTTLWRSFNTVLPPNTKRLVATVNRSASGAAATIRVFVGGYLIPPGGIGRLA
jgi:hypothetical protein